MLSEQGKFIFVHVPKTGGNSIQTVLTHYSESELTTDKARQDGVERFGVRHPRFPINKHSPLGLYRRLLGPDAFHSYFKFAAVRNPWERALSAYFQPGSPRTEWNREVFVKHVMKIRPMLHFLDSRNIRGPLRRFVRMRVDVDFVIRFEKLQEDFDTVCDRLGIGRHALPHRNRSKSGAPSEYYDDELIRLVGRRFRCDIEASGYEFPEDLGEEMKKRSRVSRQVP